MRISLRPELERFVNSKVSSGSFSDPTDVVSAALEALQSQERWDAKDVAELRRAVAKGTAELDAGQSEEWDVDQVKAEGRAALARRRRGEGGRGPGAQ